MALAEPATAHESREKGNSGRSRRNLYRSLASQGEDERGMQHKMKVVTLIDRETKQARSVVMGKINSVSIGRVVAANAARLRRCARPRGSGFFTGTHSARRITAQ